MGAIGSHGWPFFGWIFLFGAKLRVPNTKFFKKVSVIFSQQEKWKKSVMIGLILNETVANLQKVFYAEIEIDFVLIEYVISLDNYPTMCAP